MARRYDMLIIDLDGTLLTREGRITPANERAMKAAQDAGMSVVIATGRAFGECEHLLGALHPAEHLIAASGSLLCDINTGATLERFAMDRSIVEHVSEAVIAEQHRALILKDRHITGYDYLAVGPAPLDPASAWWFDHHSVRVRQIETIIEDPHPADSLRAGAVACQDQMLPLAAQLQTEIGEVAFLQHWSAVTASEATGSATHLLEVFSPNVHKWTMAQRLCARIGIAPDRVAAIGDGLNDVQLIEHAQLGVAIGNAESRVLAVADRVTAADHNHDGVAEAISQILNGAW